jgi:hypothetical protein
VPVEPDARRIREVGADLDEPGPEVRIQDIEVVDPDAPPLAEELKAHDARCLGAVARAEDPLELLAGHDRHDPEPALTLRRLQVRADVVELAVIPARPVGRLQPQDRDLVSVGEPPDVAPKAVADRAQHRGRRDRLAQVPGDEPHDLPANLQIRDIGVQQKPVDALDLERHVRLQDVVDVRHARVGHGASIHQEGRLCRPGAQPATGEAGRGTRPPPAKRP